ncbi:MAG TPA: NADPH-dependent F420 reductase [Candidatus Acidoferrales bacterium]|nr:NADPH-dependent F420 reductase [Candidatus Acidoferrales bacterium]
MGEEKIAIIGGTGDLGFGLALRWARAGVPVVVGSRDPSKAREAAQRVGETIKQHAPTESGRVSVSGLENAEAAAQASFVVLAVPITAQVEILKSIRGSLRDCILVDATVPLAAALGGKPTRLLKLWQGSAAGQTRELVPATIPVLAAFHNVSAVVLQNLAATPDCDILTCGDDESAKQTLFRFVKLIPGLRPVDAGPLEMSGIVEGLTALLISVNRRYRVHHSGIRITGLEGKA